MATTAVNVPEGKIVTVEFKCIACKENANIETEVKRRIMSGSVYRQYDESMVKNLYYLTRRRLLVALFEEEDPGEDADPINLTCLKCFASEPEHKGTVVPDAAEFKIKPEELTVKAHCKESMDKMRIPYTRRDFKMMVDSNALD